MYWSNLAENSPGSFSEESVMTKEIFLRITSQTKLLSVKEVQFKDVSPTDRVARLIGEFFGILRQLIFAIAKDYFSSCFSICRKSYKLLVIDKWNGSAENKTRYLVSHSIYNVTQLHLALLMWLIAAAMDQQYLRYHLMYPPGGYFPI